MLVDGAISVEPRASAGGVHLIAFRFNGTVNTPGAVTVTDASLAPIGFASCDKFGNEVLVTLTGIGDNQRLIVTLSGVNGATGAAVAAGFPVGDFNDSRGVNAGDISAVKAQLGQGSNAANFRFDVNTSGSINARDVSAVKARAAVVLR